MISAIEYYGVSKKCTQNCNPTLNIIASWFRWATEPCGLIFTFNTFFVDLHISYFFVFHIGCHECSRQNYQHYKELSFFSSAYDDNVFYQYVLLQKYFVVMQSIFYPSHRIETRFDIKGALAGRYQQVGPCLVCDGRISPDSRLFHFHSNMCMCLS